MTGSVTLPYHCLMTPAAVRRARKTLGLSRSRFAALLGVHPVTVKKWERGAQGMRSTAALAIRLLLAQKRGAPAARRRRGGR